MGKRIGSGTIGAGDFSDRGIFCTEKRLADRLRIEEKYLQALLAALIETGNVLQFGNLFCHRKKKHGFAGQFRDFWKQVTGRARSEEA